MTHLVIQQKGVEDGGSVETVSNAVISTLYNLSNDPNLISESTDLRGDLRVGGTYQRYIDALHTKYPNLNITADSYYMYFVDHIIEQYWATSESGDGSGITQSSAQSITTWPRRNTEYNAYAISNAVRPKTDIGCFAFTEDPTISTFDELQYFTNLTYIPAYAFAGSSLSQINLNNIITLHPGAFKYCSQLTTVDLPNL